MTVGRLERAWVSLLLVVMLVAGIIGFDAWPLTAWRLFSLARDDTQNGWVLESVDVDGRTTDVDFTGLPLAFRIAAWPLDAARDADHARRSEVCLALLTGVRAVDADVRGLRVQRSRDRLAEEGDRWARARTLEPFAECGALS